MKLCEQIIVLKILYILKQLLSVAVVVIPLILIILISMDIFKTMINDPDKMGDTINRSMKRFISAVIIFFVPTIVFSIYNSVLNSKFDVKLLCIDNATKENISKLEIDRKATLAKLQEEDNRKYEESVRKIEEERKLREAEQKKKEEERKKQEYESINGLTPSITSGSTTPIINGTPRALNKGDCMSWEDNCFCPSKGKVKGFQFIMSSETGRNFANVRGRDNFINVSETCSDGHTYKVVVNSALEENYRLALKNICKLQTTGINGVKISASDIDGMPTISSRTNSKRTICSLHAYGSAVDINYSKTITVNGTSFMPYSGQGTSTRQRYNAFVNAIGGESNPKNINYILWIYAFKPAGFVWGGTWSDAYFDPMHFETY